MSAMKSNLAKAEPSSISKYSPEILMEPEIKLNNRSNFAPIAPNHYKLDDKARTNEDYRSTSILMMKVFPCFFRSR